MASSNLKFVFLVSFATYSTAEVEIAKTQFTEQWKNQTQAFHQWWNNLFLTYDSRIRPFFNARPLKIDLGLTLLSVSSISEENMEWTVEMYFHEYWSDARLIFNKTAFGGRDPLTLPQDAFSKLWTPDTSFINAIRCQYPTVGSVSHLSLLRLYEDGRLFSARRLSVTAECNMDLTMYPFDKQACMLELSSFGFLVDDIQYDWRLGSMLDNVDNINLPDYTAVSSSLRVINKTYVAGEYSVPQLCIVFSRRAGFCFLQLFIPATGAVAASWISLWLENETHFADIVAIILSIIFLSFSYNTVMPKVSYIKAMDMYMGACFIFAFLSLAKLAVVKYMRMKLAKRERDSVFQEQLLFLTVANVTTESSSRSSASRRASRIRLHDGYWKVMKVFHVGSQLILPLAFVAFAVFYFFIYPFIQPQRGRCFIS